jgi:sugar fermentation stimulation protein A
MEFTKSLIKGKLIKRYKRFFTDVKLGKEIVTAHCPNTGSMKGLLDEGNDVYVLPNNDPKRKLKYGLEIIKTRKNLVGVNTHMANRIAQHALENNLIKELKDNDLIKPEVFFNKETRFDFLIEKKKQKSFVEVKNVTLFRDKNTAEFPDAVTSRGSKHLLTLIDAIKKGYKTYLLFLVQIQNMEYFKIAKDIDPEYYKNYLLAKKQVLTFWLIDVI